MEGERKSRVKKNEFLWWVWFVCFREFGEKLTTWWHHSILQIHHHHLNEHSLNINSVFGLFTFSLLNNNHHLRRKSRHSNCEIKVFDHAHEQRRREMNIADKIDSYPLIRPKTRFHPKIMIWNRTESWNNPTRTKTDPNITWTWIYPARIDPIIMTTTWTRPEKLSY